MKYEIKKITKAIVFNIIMALFIALILFIVSFFATINYMWLVPTLIVYQFLFNLILHFSRGYIIENILLMIISFGVGILIDYHGWVLWFL